MFGDSKMFERNMNIRSSSDVPGRRNDRLEVKVGKWNWSAEQVTLGKIDSGVLQCQEFPEEGVAIARRARPVGRPQRRFQFVRRQFRAIGRGARLLTPGVTETSRVQRV